ncbi:GNAT family N-acetyltransferase [Brevibacterium daeguense]|uniref:GNAT family N-acetyltransferase n=1 Tax=Brevibacterium daeguense TaxID=909936 RepID=A0ABP8EJX1_9MICO|nr:GNAT family N-acetyltransferase [Brevibacterium daeguense]
MGEGAQQHDSSERARRRRITIRTLDRPGDLGWVVMAHGEVYAEEFGWGCEFEALVAGTVAEYASDHDPAREAAWIAEADGQRLGCVFCVTADPVTAQLVSLLVHPSARCQGVGGKLVDTCLDFAWTAGYQRISLWTNDVQASAQRIWQAAGFHLVEEEYHSSFGHDLVGQIWQRDL